MKYILSIFILIFVSCTHIAKEKIVIPNVFIHGSHFDKDIWNPVIESLVAYQNIAITLKGRGGRAAVGLTEMAKDVCNQVPTQSRIIAHSFGGAVANQMVGICPQKIERIIYIAALVPIKGEQSFDVVSKADQDAYGKAVIFKKDTIEPRKKLTFLEAMDSEIHTKNIPLFKIYAESYKPGEDRIAYDLKMFASIPKYYIYTSRDEIVGSSTQESYTKRTTMIKTTTVPTGHLPMLSDPSKLVTKLRDFL